MEALITAHGLPATGLSDVLLTLRRVADDFFLDFADSNFKAAGWTEREHVMAEVDATNAPGMYSWPWNTTGQNSGQYTARVTCASGHNVPQICDLHTGEYVDHLDAAITSRQSEADATARSLLDLAAHGVTQGDIAALPVAPTAAAITSAILDEALAGHLTPGTVGHAILVGLAVPQQNVVLDGGAGKAEIEYDANGLMLSGRLRVFATPAAAIAATAGAIDGADAEISLIMYMGTAHSLFPKMPGTYKGVVS